MSKRSCITLHHPASSKMVVPNGPCTSPHPPPQRRGPKWGKISKTCIAYWPPTAFWISNQLSESLCFLLFWLFNFSASNSKQVQPISSRLTLWSARVIWQTAVEEVWLSWRWHCVHLGYPLPFLSGFSFTLISNWDIKYAPKHSVLVLKWAKIRSTGGGGYTCIKTATWKKNSNSCRVAAMQNFEVLSIWLKGQFNLASVLTSTTGPCFTNFLGVFPLLRSKSVHN